LAAPGADAAAVLEEAERADIGGYSGLEARIDHEAQRHEARPAQIAVVNISTLIELVCSATFVGEHRSKLPLSYVQVANDEGLDGLSEALPESGRFRRSQPAPAAGHR
jgi:hypothetical protein